MAKCQVRINNVANPSLGIIKNFKIYSRITRPSVAAIFNARRMVNFVSLQNYWNRFCREKFSGTTQWTNISMSRPSNLLEVSISHNNDRLKGFSQTIKREQFRFGMRWRKKEGLLTRIASKSRIFPALPFHEISLGPTLFKCFKMLTKNQLFFLFSFYFFVILH